MKMKKKIEKRLLVPRLPMEVVKLLRSKGGAIKPQKGGGYNRKAEKQRRAEE